MIQAPENSRGLAFYLGGLMMVALMGTYTVPLVIGALIDGLAMSAQSAGMLGSVEIFSIALSAFILSRLITIHNLRLIAQASMALCVISQGLSSMTDDYSWLLLFRVAAGLGSGGLLAVVNLIVATSKSPGVLYGWVLAISSSGFALMLALLPNSLVFYQQQGLFLAIAFVCLLLSPLLWLLPKQIYAGSGQLAEQSSERCSALLIGLFFLVLTIVYLAMGGVWAFSERVANNLSIDPEFIGVLLGLSTLAGIAGAASAAILAKAGRFTMPVVAGFIVSGVSVLLIAASAGVLSYAAGILLYGYCYMFTVTFVLGTAAELDSEGRVAIATNAYLLIPYSLGPSVFGLVGLDNIQALGWVCLAGCMLAALMVLPVSRHAEKLNFSIEFTRCN
jgi:predicted MFS family arabinose efflux permease